MIISNWEALGYDIIKFTLFATLYNWDSDQVRELFFDLLSLVAKAACPNLDNLITL